MIGKPLPCFVLVLALLLLGSTHAKAQKPNATWVPIFFESIHRFEKRAGLLTLESSKVAPTDIEIRVWAGFGLGPLHLLRIRRIAGKSTIALHAQLPQTADLRSTDLRWLNLKPDISSDDFWNKLQTLEIFRLPDSSTLPKEGYTPVRDGTSYVVEYQMNGAYRAYEYGNPALMRWPEAKQFLKLIEYLKASTDMYDAARCARSMKHNMCIFTL